MPMMFVITELSGGIANWGMRSVCGSASTVSVSPLRTRTIFRWACREAARLSCQTGVAAWRPTARISDPSMTRT